MNGGWCVFHYVSELGVSAYSPMEWSKPKWQDVPPNQCVSYAGVTLIENWFFAGGGNNKNDVCEAFVISYILYFPLAFIKRTVSEISLCTACSFQDFVNPCTLLVKLVVWTIFN
ncbi:hypothetical protein C4D60_Mb11t24270 [Musa balbisiana]|uniref:Uncharacterized protein n=1 Tax=Musa balbisiana TaxID=52838 RepID=A0A4V4H5R9_MUSBA|nr:hypothetical protein C4D60_Mb11t24270 [Musa balbisiana]